MIFLTIVCHGNVMHLGKSNIYIYRHNWDFTNPLLGKLNVATMTQHAINSETTTLLTMISFHMSRNVENVVNVNSASLCRLLKG